MQIVDLSTYLCNVSLTLLTFTLGHHNILLPVTECPSWSPNTLLSLLCYACSLLLLSLPESQNRFLSLIFTLSFGSVQKPPFKSLNIMLYSPSIFKFSVTFRLFLSLLEDEYWSLPEDFLHYSDNKHSFLSYFFRSCWKKSLIFLCYLTGFFLTASPERCWNS